MLILLWQYESDMILSQRLCGSVWLRNCSLHNQHLKKNKIKPSVSCLQKKCERYYPQLGEEPMSFGPFRISCVSCCFLHTFPSMPYAAADCFHYFPLRLSCIRTLFAYQTWMYYKTFLTVLWLWPSSLICICHRQALFRINSQFPQMVWWCGVNANSPKHKVTTFLLCTENEGSLSLFACF